MIKLIIFVFAIMAFIYSLHDVLTNPNSSASKATFITSAIVIFGLIADYLNNLRTRIKSEKTIPKQFKNTSPTIKNAIEALHTPNKSDNAIETLRNTEDKDAIDVLVWALQIQDESLKEKIATALAEKTNYTDAHAIPVFVSLLHNAREKDLERHLSMLAKLLQGVPKENIKDLNSTLKALIPLTYSPYKNEGIKLSNPKFENDTYGIQAFAQQILINFFPVESLPLLIEALAQRKGYESVSGVTIIETINQLALKAQTNKNIPITDAVPALISGLSYNYSYFIHTIHRTYSAKELAIQTLINIGEDDDLIKALKKAPHSHYEQQLITEILEKIGTKKAITAVEQWKTKTSNS